MIFFLTERIQQPPWGWCPAAPPAVPQSAPPAAGSPSWCESSHFLSARTPWYTHCSCRAGDDIQDMQSHYAVCHIFNCLFFIPAGWFLINIAEWTFEWHLIWYSLFFVMLPYSPVQQRCEERLDFLEHCILGFLWSMHSGRNTEESLILLKPTRIIAPWRCLLLPLKLIHLVMHWHSRFYAIHHHCVLKTTNGAKQK